VEPLLVHHHLPKTAGRSLRKVMQANFARGELVNLTGLEDADPARWYRDYWESLPAHERMRVRCVTSHFSQHLIPVVAERPVRAFCTLREPVERVISLFFFTRWIHENGRPSPMLAAMEQRGWGLGDVYRNLGCGRDRSPEDAALFWRLFNGQTREILEPESDPAVPAFAPAGCEPIGIEDEVRARLDRLYVVGVSERFSQSIRLFADSFGWSKVFIPRVNVRPYPWDRSEIDAETRSLIRSHNRVDEELHAEHLARVSALPRTPRRSDLRWRAHGRWRRSLWLARRAARRARAGRT
jgi:hypothetical protein